MTNNNNNYKDKPKYQIDIYGDAFIGNRKSKSPFPDWSMNNSVNIGKLAKLGLSGSCLSVFLWIIANLDFDNLIIINQSEFARELNISRFGVSKAIKSLIEHGLIKKTNQTIGTSSVYLVNPIYVFKGKSKSYSEIVELYFINN